MNILRKLLPHQAQKLVPRFLETNSGSTSNKLIVEQLKERALLRVQGAEVAPFLQGLITNDIYHLTDKPTVPNSMYAMFLNKSGRVLYDTIIYRTSEPNLYYIECDKSASTELRRHLLLYRVRRKIDVDHFDDAYKPWVVYSTELNSSIALPTPTAKCDNLYITADPRVKDLGLRVLMPTEYDCTQLSSQFSSSQLDVAACSDTENYCLQRYRCGVGEGVLEIPAGKAFPLEANCDFLHGVSFHKGCYVGQELTARVYHTGVVRKRYMPMRLTDNVGKPESAVQAPDGGKVGVVRGILDKRALALLRVEQALKAEHLVIEGQQCYAEKPHWWPKEMPVKGSMREAV